MGAALESTTQIFLKKGALRHNGTAGLGYYAKLLRDRWVISGIIVYLFEMCIWIVILSYIPLSIAFPLTGLQKVMVVLFAFFILKERITGYEWAGIGLTALGIAVISI